VDDEAQVVRPVARKRQEYFAAGVRLVWIVDPVARTIAVYTAPEQSTVLQEAQTLAGEPVLPGFTLPLRRLLLRSTSSHSPFANYSPTEIGVHPQPPYLVDARWCNGHLVAVRSTNSTSPAGSGATGK
jgi:hypothetical protein